MLNKFHHSKLTKKKIKSYLPSNKEGNNGDIQIVSIKGKGTYLCLKDKGGWKISDKFNQRYKAGKHEFDKLKMHTIKNIKNK